MADSPATTEAEDRAALMDVQEAILRAMVLERMERGREYVNALMRETVALLSLLVVTSVQIGAFYYILPNEPQLCYINRSSHRWFCENGESSTGLADQYGITAPATKETMCGWYGVFAILLDLIIVVFALALPSWVARNPADSTMSDSQHRATLVILARTVLRFGVLTHALLIVIYQCLFDAVLHQYKSFQTDGLVSLMAAYCAGGVGLIAHLFVQLRSALEDVDSTQPASATPPVASGPPSPPSSAPPAGALSDSRPATTSPNGPSPAPGQGSGSARARAGTGAPIADPPSDSSSFGVRRRGNVQE